MAGKVTYAVSDDLEDALEALTDVAARLPLQLVNEAEKAWSAIDRARAELRAARPVAASEAGGTDRFRQVHGFEPIGGPHG